MSEEEKKPEPSKTTPGMWIAVIVMAGLISAALTFCGGNGSKGNDSPSTTKAGLTGGSALTACEEYAEHEAPYGFKTKTFDTDVTTTDDRITIVYHDAKVGTAVGGELTQTIRCDVGGTDGAPSVLSFGSID